MKKKKVVVLGSQGFLGRNMVDFLKSKKKYEVYGSLGDLREYDLALEATYEIDWVFNFAANMGGIGYFSEENYYPPMDNFQIDVNVLRACEENKVKRLFYPSSACAYPVSLMNSGVQLSEWMLDDKAEPDQMYGWEKLTMIKLMRNSPIDCRVGVLHTVYGPGQEYQGRKAKFPPQMAYKAIQAKKTGELEVWGDGNQTRTFLYITDAIEKIYEVMSTDGYQGEVNIGSEQEYSIMNVVGACCKILDMTPTISYNMDKPTGPVRRLCDNTKFNKYYKYRDKVRLDEGFEKIISYIQKHE